MRRKGRNISGILLLDKPPGINSNAALQQVKHLFKAQKAGHTGSLDNLASGLLAICLGKATKISAYLLNADKRYQAVCTLGTTTATGDAEGKILAVRSPENVTRRQVDEVIKQFIGPIQQIPPMHSALKRQGQPLYKLARQGVVIEREARPITIHELTVTDFDGKHLHIYVHCSKGTYVRTLAEDIGEALGCGAHLGGLRRIGVGPFMDMMGFDELETRAEQGLAALDELLLPMESALADWPEVKVSEGVAYYLRQGQAVQVSRAPTEGWVRLVAAGSGFFGIGEILENGRVAPKRLIDNG
ncbi:MAG: tRNA pseudouridine(55) synthase TruB [Gammaproteobacteria bacterium]|nr:tRNA pseudouridine(55) synthase TruB [Gammaproteobacteria bacterium]